MRSEPGIHILKNIAGEWNVQWGLQIGEREDEETVKEGFAPAAGPIGHS